MGISQMNKAQLIEQIKKLQKENKELKQCNENLKNHQSFLDDYTLMSNLELIEKFTAINVSKDYIKSLFDKTKPFRNINSYLADGTVIKTTWRKFPDGNLVEIVNKNNSEQMIIFFDASKMIKVN